MANFDFIYNIFYVSFAILVAVLGALYLFQNKILYLPVVQGIPKSFEDNPEGIPKTPADKNIPFEDVYINTKDNVKLHGWILKNENSEKIPTVVFFHENAGNIGTRVSYLDYYTHYVPVNIIIIAYRGYSNSEGIPTEEGLQLDAQAILDHVFQRKDIDLENIYLHGRSLGGAVAIYAASQIIEYKFKIKGLIVENTFLSIPDMVAVLFPKIQIFKKFLLKNYWPSADRIKNITIPILFVISWKDELVPKEHMEKLYVLATQAKQKFRHDVKTGDHNGNWTKNPQAYFSDILKFIFNLNNITNQ